MNYPAHSEISPVDVCLISPPFAFTYGPSLALSLLKAALLRDGMSCYVDYADIYAMHTMEMSLYWEYNNGRMNEFIGEYLFAELAGITPKYGIDEMMTVLRRQHSIPASIEIRNAVLEGKQLAAEVVEETVERVLRRNPKIVGVTSCFQQRNSAVAILRRIKAVRPDVITVMGGANCFGQAGLAMLRQFPFIDYVFFGESDDIFAPVCRSAMEGRKESLPYGVLRNGEPLPETAPHRIITDMDSLPYPDFDDFFQLISRDVASQNRVLADYFYKDHPHICLFLEHSRGCWWGEKKACTFCGLHGAIRQFRRKSPQRALDEMCALSEKYGVYDIMLTDCVLPREWIQEFLPLLKARPHKFHIFQEIRCHLSAEDIELLAQCGYTYIQPGIESLSEHELKLMNKGISVMQNLNFMKHARRWGIRLTWNDLHGFPGEVVEDFEEQIRLFPLIHHLQPPGSCSRLIIARDNEYANHPEKYGFKLRPSSIYDFFCPQDPSYIDDVAIYYESNILDTPEVIQAAERLYQAVMEWRSKHRCARLDVADLGDKLLVIDTRPCRDLRAQYLQGIEGDIYRQAISPVRMTALYDRLPQYTPEQIDQGVQMLTAKKLVYCHQGSVLALALPFDLEELKKRDILDFQKRYHSNPQMQQFVDDTIKDRICQEGDTPAVIRSAITQCAGRMGMCFTGEDYERFSLPVNAKKC